MDYRECLEILGLKNATSQKQVDMAYRNMVHTWNPDRFPFDAELRKHAEEKLRKINFAYEQLSAHLSLGHEQEKRAWLKRKPNPKSKPSERPETAGYYPKSPYAKSATSRKPGQPRQRPSVIPSASGPVRTSSAGKYMVFGLLLLFGGFTVFIINYLLKLDQSDFDNRAPTSSIMKKLTDESPSSESTKKSGSRKRELKKPGYSEKEKSDSGLSTRQGNYYEIYLKRGGVIIAEKWWEQGNMIMYKTKFGTMGIEKDSVDNIIRK
jgi:curved DNA-binding protein CbpA